MKNIHVISQEIDGAELRRRQYHNKYISRCHGKNDDQNIQEAIYHSCSAPQFKIDGEVYERIFGK